MRKLGDTGKKTGYSLSEVTHPWSVLGEFYDIDVVSPEGGRPPLDLRWRPWSHVGLPKQRGAGKNSRPQAITGVGISPTVAIALADT